MAHAPLAIEEDLGALSAAKLLIVTTFIESGGGSPSWLLVCAGERSLRPWTVQCPAILDLFLPHFTVVFLKRNELASAVWKATAGRVPLRDLLDPYWLAFWLDARCAFSSDKGKNERPHGQIVGEGNGRGSSVGNTQGSGPDSGGVWNRPAH